MTTNTIAMKIICPIDFKPASLNALEFAARIAEHKQEELWLVHFLPKRSGIRSIEDGPSSDREMVDRMNRLCELTESNFNVKAFPWVEYAPFHEKLKQLSKERDTDLLVMGTAGVTSISEYFFGSNTGDFVEKSASPLLTIPETVSFDSIQHIAYACNYEPDDDEFVNRVLPVAKFLNADVTVVHVGKKDEPYGEEIFESFAHSIERHLEGYTGNLRYERILSEDIEAGLIDFVHNQGIDMVVTLSEHRGFFESLFHSSLSRRLVMLAEFPVLVYHKRHAA